MARKEKKTNNALNLTRQEAESMGVEMENEEPPKVREETRELPMHEQVAGALTEDDVAEAFEGEVTEESREEVEEAVGDLQEDEAENEG